MTMKTLTNELNTKFKIGTYKEVISTRIEEIRAKLNES